MINKAEDIKQSMAHSQDKDRVIQLLMHAMYTSAEDPKAALQELAEYDVMVERGDFVQSQTATQCHAAYRNYIGAVARARLEPGWNPTSTFQRANDLLDSCPDRLFTANAMMLIAIVLEFNLRFQDMRQMLQRVEVIFDGSDVMQVPSELFESYSRELAASDRDYVTFQRAFTMQQLARAYRFSGQFDQAFRYYYRALQIYELLDTVGSRNFRIINCVDAIHLCCLLGLEKRADELWSDANMLARETQDEHVHHLLKMTEISLRSVTFDTASFEHNFQSLWERSFERRQNTHLNILLNARADHYAAQERWQDAARAIDEGLKYCNLPRNMFSRAVLSISAGYIRLELGDTQGARLAANEAIEHAQCMGNRYFEMEANAILARAHLKDNDAKTAYAALSRHLELKHQTLGPHIIHQIADAENEYKNGALREELRRVKFQNDVLQGELRRQAELIQHAQAQERDSIGQHVRLKTNGVNGHASSGRATSANTDQNGHKDPWKNFIKEFRVEYPGFNSRMLDACPDLTETECKICAMCRAGLSVKESADILFLTENSILKNRWRIRKKLKLQRSVKLSIYLRSI